MTTITVSSKYQIVLPREAREKPGIKPGCRLQVRQDERGLHLVKEPSLAEIRGLLKGMVWNEEGVRNETDRELWTQDAHFQNLPGVKFFRKA